MLLHPEAPALVLSVLLAGLALDAISGDLTALWRSVPHPVAWVGAAVQFFDRRLNRESRGATARRVRGALVAGVLVGAAFGLGWALDAGLGALPAGRALEAVAVALLLAQRSLFAHVARVARSLRAGGLAAGRKAVAEIVGRDPDSLDAHGVARAAIESLAENFSDGVVAPAFWYAALGLPGLFAYKTANTLDSMIGHRTPRHLAFGWAAARLDDLLNFAPARLAALFLGLGAFVAREARGRAALAVMWRDGAKHRSPKAGWPEAAAAGALDLALAGPRRYGGVVEEAPWLGSGRARASPDDIVRALRLYVAACAVQALVVLAALAVLLAA